MGKRKAVPDSDGLAGEEDKSSVDSSRSIKRQSMRTDMLLQTINEQMATIHVFSILQTSEGWNSKTAKRYTFYHYYFDSPECKSGRHVLDTPVFIELLDCKVEQRQFY